MEFETTPLMIELEYAASEAAGLRFLWLAMEEDLRKEIEKVRQALKVKNVK